MGKVMRHGWLVWFGKAAGPLNTPPLPGGGGLRAARHQTRRTTQREAEPTTDYVAKGESNRRRVNGEDPSHPSRLHEWSKSITMSELALLALASPTSHVREGPGSGTGLESGTSTLSMVGTRKKVQRQTRRICFKMPGI